MATIDKLYGTGIPRPRVETDIADSGDAADYPNSELIISGADYIIKRSSNGVEWYSQGSGPIASRPSAALFGVGIWHCRDDNITCKCNGTIWEVDGETSIKKTNGINVTTFATGIAGLFATSPGSGGTITTPASGSGIRIQQASGVNVSNSFKVNVTPFLLEADTTINVVAYINDAAKCDNIDFYVTTQASNFVGYLNINPTIKPILSSVKIGGGLMMLTVTGAELDATPHGDASIRIGSIIDRMQLVVKCSEGLDIEIRSITINPVVTPMFPIYFDDSAVTQYTEAFTYMSKKGLKGTIGVVGSFIGNGFSLSLAQAQEMYAAGWDMINHSYDHLGGNTGSAYGGSGATNQIALAQTVTAGNLFTLSGAVGSALFDAPRCLVFTSAGNDSAKRFTVVGLDENGLATTETIMGGNTTIYVPSATVWSKITSITAVESTAGNVTIGLSQSYAELLYSIGTNKTWLETNGFTRGLDCYIAPGGQINTLSYRVFNALGITKVRGIVSNNEQPHLVPQNLHISSYASGIANGGSATVIAVKDKVKARWTTNSLYLHTIVPDSNASPTSTEARVTDFRAVIDSIATDVNAGNLICPSMSEACRISGY